MRGRRYLLVGLLAAVMLPTLLTTGGFAWYWRSARYRQHCARILTNSLQLPGDIGRIVPRSWCTREFQDVRVWLPHRRDEAAFCRSAILTCTPSRDDLDAYELDLRGGRSEISTRTWLREDYRYVLESGLRPGFDPTGPRRVVFSGMDLAFERERFRASLTDASGEVSFVDPHRGHATARCRRLNGYLAPRDVCLDAAFSPQATGIRLDRVELSVPELPVALVGLKELAGLSLKSGSFNGQLVYRELAGQDEPANPGAPADRARDEHELTVSGQLLQLQLAECTAGFFRPPWRGTVPELELQELRLVNGRPERIRFRGALAAMHVGDVLALWGLAGVGGDLSLRIQAADLSPAGIEHLTASGRCEDLSLAEVTQALGLGQVTGRAQLVLDGLSITRNHLDALDAELVVQPPTSEPRPSGGGPAAEANYIDRRFVTEALRRTLGVELPEALVAQLPERFEYSRLGVRFELRDEVLHVFGTHGPRQKVILSMSLAGREVPIVLEPEKPFDLRAYLDGLRSRVLPEVEQRWRRLTPADAWRALSSPAQPAEDQSPERKRRVADQRAASHPAPPAGPDRE